MAAGCPKPKQLKHIVVPVPFFSVVSRWIFSVINAGQNSSRTLVSISDLQEHQLGSVRVVSMNDPYQYHIARLTAENKALQQQLVAERVQHTKTERVLRVQLDEAITPKMKTLERERNKFRDELRQLRGQMPKTVPIDASVRGLGPRMPQALSANSGRILKQIKKQLRHTGVLLGQARAEIDRLRKLPERISQQDLNELVELIELRRQDLLELVGMMQSSPASSTHNGTRSYRPVPSNRGTI
jgi:hypothetical protein